MSENLLTENLIEKEKRTAVNNSRETLPLMQGVMITIRGMYPEVEGVEGVVVGQSDGNPIVDIGDIINEETYPYKALIVPRDCVTVMKDDKGFVLTEERLREKRTEESRRFNEEQIRRFQESCKDGDERFEETEFYRKAAKKLAEMSQKNRREAIEEAVKVAAETGYGAVDGSRLNLGLNFVQGMMFGDGKKEMEEKEKKETGDGSHYERFSDRARKALQLANQEAQRFNQEYVSTEHVLLGLLKEGSGIAANVLKNLNIDLGKLRHAVEKCVPIGSDTVTMGKLPHTPRTKMMLEYARKEAKALRHCYIGTEHILLGLLSDRGSCACNVLASLGVCLDTARKEVLSLLGCLLEEKELEKEPPEEELEELSDEIKTLRDRVAAFENDLQRYSALEERDWCADFVHFTCAETGRELCYRDDFVIGVRGVTTAEAAQGANACVILDARMSHRDIPAAGLNVYVKETLEYIFGE